MKPSDPDGRPSRAIGINDTVPAPLIRLLEGQTALPRVVTDLRPAIRVRRISNLLFRRSCRAIECAGVTM
ncbi:hypothetical protein C1T17_20130 (plasmid) [Sphingobium sp. SCG-1]|nr:hypothetical protein C1T17_20130 [Sphingobium sp. SCG-1]